MSKRGVPYTVGKLKNTPIRYLVREIRAQKVLGLKVDNSQKCLGSVPEVSWKCPGSVSGVSEATPNNPREGPVGATEAYIWGNVSE